MLETMSKMKELMTDIYNTLVQIRYPKITTSAAQDIELTILSGENRISLLSWILIEKSPLEALTLPKLKDDALKDHLFKCYSEIGICTDKNQLLGDCPLEEQYSTLSLLLDFIKCVFNESFYIKHSEEDPLNVYINEDLNTSSHDIDSKLNYSEAMQYFDNLEKSLNEYRDSSHNCEFVKETLLEKCSLEDEKQETTKGDRHLLFNETATKFIDVFSSVESWSIANTKSSTNKSYSMDADINEIYSNFSTLTQFLQAKEEIINSNIQKSVDNLSISLNEIFGRTVSHTEEAIHTCMDNY